MFVYAKFKSIFCFGIKMLMLPKHLKIGLISFLVFVGNLIVCWVIVPAIIKSQIKKQMALSKKTDVRQMWEVIPFALDFKIYFFNYTNVDDIQKGAKPIVKEVGPYYFEEWKEKVDIEDHEDTDTITYKRKDTFYFKPELSGPGLTGDEIIVMPHPLLFAMINKIHSTKPAMLSMISKAINGIFENPSTFFITAKAIDLLFHGVRINCDRTEFAPKAVCTALKKEAANSFVIQPNNQLMFSLFGPRNGSVNPQVITVLRGIKNIMDVGKVIAVDGKEEQDRWSGHCKQYEGTDGTIFPPFLTKHDRLESFSLDLCRTFKPWYQRKSYYRGIATHRYIVNIGNLANDTELHCYCSPPGSCPLRGLMYLEECIGAPFAVSPPHFYDADPSLQNLVDGLHPNMEDHEIYIDFEPVSGTPMVAKQRVQLNINLLKTDKVEQCANLTNTLVPLFWLEEGLALNKTFVNMLKFQLFYPKRAVGLLRWFIMFCCVYGMLGSMAYHFKDTIMRFADVKWSPSSPKVNPRQGMDAQEDRPSKIE
ncbi:sensory neuron membrane protein 1-like [Aricia agestis]|uniref:sensory neuron membrane protein 1-like n=1 Tax=Aricia agestis TaxID=91739 RepID=UPI001C20478C|nr:sensory neuron membrane protein 1-like [Aricia agestis]